MKAIIKAIIAGSVIIGVGVIVLVIALALNGWKIAPDFEIAEYVSEGEIGELKIENAVGNIKTEFYDGDRVMVSYPVSDRYTMSVGEKDGLLTIDGLHKKHWYSFTFLTGMLPETIVKIPRSAVLKLAVTVNAGTVELAAGRYAETGVTLNAGALNVLGMTCSDFKCEVNAGSISVKSLESASLDCKVKAGAFHAERIDCPFVKVSVAAGSAELSVQGNREEYTISVDKSAGSCNVAGQTGSDPDKRIDIDVSAGSCNVSFI